MHLSKFRVSASLVMLASVLLTMPTSATTYGEKCRVGNASCVRGNISVSNNVTSWSLTVKDNKRDGNCAYAKIIIDRSLIPDVELTTSPRACGYGKTVAYNGNSVGYLRTVGARVYACVDRNLQPDSCTEAFYESE